jgi:hypothetical protein
MIWPFEFPASQLTPLSYFWQSFGMIGWFYLSITIFTGSFKTMPFAEMEFRAASSSSVSSNPYLDSSIKDSNGSPMKIEFKKPVGERSTEGI